ncbi:hypothetical protein BESB_055550 [Besnoitia besnoiti]|uniref:Transmembrane protein n=1 Tax=Besnoitia besnoiti TaxID=94643 RepID=A0A2A9MFC7_BESBE|nr:hypothetical protein BESB_055550 [Besnoitia besnoiti]PFH35904.1 hypothetical protein BESB_055550 [Besnoitia besnoiti]
MTPRAPPPSSVTPPPSASDSPSWARSRALEGHSRAAPVQPLSSPGAFESSSANSGSHGSPIAPGCLHAHDNGSRGYVQPVVAGAAPPLSSPSSPRAASSSPDPRRLAAGDKQGRVLPLRGRSPCERSLDSAQAPSSSSHNSAPSTPSPSLSAPLPSSSRRPAKRRCPPIGCRCVPVPKELSAYCCSSEPSSLLSFWFEPRLFFRTWPFEAAVRASAKSSCLPVPPSVRFSFSSSVLPNLIPIFVFTVFPFLSLLSLYCLVPSSHFFILFLAALPFLPLVGLGVASWLFFTLSWLAVKLAAPA